MQDDQDDDYSLHAPFNWCDRRCERCPLADECVIATADAERRSAHESVGIDPDAPEVMQADVLRTLERALALVTEAARSQGLDPEQILAEPPPEPSETATQRRELAIRLAQQIYLACTGLGSEVASRAIERSTVVAMKVARIAEADAAEVASNIDAAANLMVLLRLEAELRSALSAVEIGCLEREEIERLRAGLCLALAPLWAAIPPHVIEQIDLLIRTDRAPSPFCVATAH
jgi:hypothetical protein